MKFKDSKTPRVIELYSGMLDILDAIGIPLEHSNDRAKERIAGACLAVGGISESFAQAKSSDDSHFLTTREIIKFENEFFGENISLGSYDDIRRKDLRYVLEALIVVRSGDFEKKATNNPTRGYALNPFFAELVKSYGKKEWSQKLVQFKERHQSFKEQLERKRNLEKIPVILPDGEKIELSVGEHNILQKKIIEEFLPIFGMGAQLLYVGDTTDKSLYRCDDKLRELNFFALEHEELPDIIAYSESKNLLYLIEAVHSTGPMDEIRVRRLNALLEKCKADVVYFTAFLDKKAFRQWSEKIAWETEVWIADNPEHLIHFNGFKFLEIHKG